MKTIFIADEDNTVRRSISTLFTDLGYRVISVSSSLDAISKLKEIKPDIVIADVSLSNGDGYEVSKKIKDDPALESILVILIASSIGVFDEVKAAEVGADDFMIKPLKPEKIMKKVESLINQCEERKIGSMFNPLSYTKNVIEESGRTEMFSEDTNHEGESLECESYREGYNDGNAEIKIQRETADFDEVILLEEDCELYREAEYKSNDKEIMVESEASELSSNEEIILLEEELMESATDVESDTKRIETLDEKSKIEIVDRVSEIVMKRLSKVIPELISKVVDSFLKEEIRKIKED